MSLNIAKSNKKRVVIVGGGFGGLKLANKLKKSGFQVVLIDISFKFFTWILRTLR